MKAQTKKALTNALIKAGWGDFFAHESWAEGGIAMSGEEWDDEKGSAGDYYESGGMYDDFGINLEISKIAAKYGCFAEWVNGGVFGIYKN